MNPTAGVLTGVVPKCSAPRLPHLFLVAGPYQSTCGANLADQPTNSTRQRSPGARDSRASAVNREIPSTGNR
jgi:hypothetical protein